MAEKAKLKMIVIDGAFSMEGQVCPLPDIKRLADKYGAVVLVDDCRAGLLRRSSRTFVFTTALSPAAVACSSKILDILKRDIHILDNLKKNTIMFRKGMGAAGFEVKGTDHPCCPVMLRDDVLTWKVANHLFQNGVFLFPVL